MAEDPGLRIILLIGSLFNKEAHIEAVDELLVEGRQLVGEVPVHVLHRNQHLLVVEQQQPAVLRHSDLVSPYHPSHKHTLDRHAPLDQMLMSPQVEFAH